MQEVPFIVQKMSLLWHFGFSAHASKESIKSGVEILTYDEVVKKTKMKIQSKKHHPLSKC